jgi:hypothetical protein
MVVLVPTPTPTRALLSPMGALTPIGDSKARVGVGVGTSTTIYDPNEKK